VKIEAANQSRTDADPLFPDRTAGDIADLGSVLRHAAADC
jgi:hypothetical protein